LSAVGALAEPGASAEISIAHYAHETAEHVVKARQVGDLTANTNLR
jgi:hypothetical protein